ncbi:hypothetical protein L596_029543 [Steinernema carpocapsae]|uniref:Kringle domain-containing protein n=1 Tax=Steinernema carpocapsae TaxID=34508 RepID=A0A4U5LUY9_STECR|nr:hypothetical protein L596_029543 [Steinernema carpocapsae]
MKPLLGAFVLQLLLSIIVAHNVDELQFTDYHYFNVLDLFEATCIPNDVPSYYYFGTKSTTWDGRECQPWVEFWERSGEPEEWKMRMANEKNYCRTEINSASVDYFKARPIPWCYYQDLPRECFRRCNKRKLKLEETKEGNKEQITNVLAPNQKKRFSHLVDNIGEVFKVFLAGDTVKYEQKEEKEVSEEKLLEHQKNIALICVTVVGFIVLAVVSFHLIGKRKRKRNLRRARKREESRQRRETSKNK